jgi:hypothetical protein
MSVVWLEFFAEFMWKLFKYIQHSLYKCAEYNYYSKVVLPWLSEDTYRVGRSIVDYFLRACRRRNWGLWAERLAKSARQRPKLLRKYSGGDERIRCRRGVTCHQDTTQSSTRSGKIWRSSKALAIATLVWTWRYSKKADRTDLSRMSGGSSGFTPPKANFRQRTCKCRHLPRAIETECGPPRPKDVAL